MRQIAVLALTALAVAAVLFVPDHHFLPEAVQESRVAFPVSAPKPQRQPAFTPTEFIAVPEFTPVPNPAPVKKQARRNTASAQFLPTKQVVVSAEVRAPASESLPVSPLEFIRYSEMTFTPELSYLRIDGRGHTGASSARLLSNMNLGSELAWRQNWSENLSTRLSGGFSRIDFLGAPNNKVITQNGKTFGRFGVGANYCIDDRWEVGTALGLRQEVFYQATGATTLRVDRVMVPRVEASIRYNLINLAPYKVGLGVRSAYLFATSTDIYEVKSGTSHRILLHIKEESLNGRIRPSAEIFYDWKKQDTSLDRKSEKEIGLQIGLTWKFEP